MTNTHTVPAFKGYITLPKSVFNQLSEKVDRNMAQKLAKKYDIKPDKDWVKDRVNAIAYDSLGLIFLEGLE